MNILVLGASSLIGSHIYQSLKSQRNHTVIGTQCKESYQELQRLDVTQPGALETFVNQHHPNVLVNSVGVVGKEACNRNPDLATLLNSTAVNTMMELCNAQGIKLVHLSSVAVHDGTKRGRYTEQDAPLQIAGNLYNITKSDAEKSASSVNKHLILRIGDTFGHAFDEPVRIGGSLFKWAYDLLKVGKEVPVFKGLRSNQTYPADIGNAVRYLIEINHQGILNLGGEEMEVGAFFERMKSTFNLPGTILQRDPPQDYQGNKALDLTRMHTLKIHMRSVEVGLDALVKNYRVV